MCACVKGYYIIFGPKYLGLRPLKALIWALVQLQRYFVD